MAATIRRLNSEVLGTPNSTHTAANDDDTDADEAEEERMKSDLWGETGLS